MPEGDSYTRAAERIRPILLDRPVVGIEGSSPSLRANSRRLLSRTVTGIRTIGKNLVIDFDNGFSLRIHLGMPGSVRVGSRPPAPRGAVRAALTTEAGTAWVVSAPTVDVERTAAVTLGLERLGPDVLAPEFDWDRFRERAGRYPPERTVSDFLLDQRVMAGVGNVYKCETLFAQRIRPDRPMTTIDIETRVALAERARRLMLPNASRAVRSTTGRRDASTWVYDRGGRPCRRCGTAIAEGWVGDPARITYWCPTCQA